MPEKLTPEVLFAGTSLAGSTHYNTVTSTASQWVFNGLSTDPPPTTSRRH